MSPNEGSPTNDLNEDFYVVALRAKMKKGINLEEAIKGGEEEIERSKVYDAAGYQAQKELLERAASFLRSLNKK